MLRKIHLTLLLTISVGWCLALTNAQAADIFFGYRDEFALSEGDEAQIDYLENTLGHTLDLWDNNRIQNNEEEATEAAEEADLVWIDESISSSRTRPLAGVSTPIINNENFACDILGMIGDGEDDDHGSPGSLNADGFEISAGTHFGKSIRIVDEDHPIAKMAGLSNGDHDVYDNPDADPELDGGRLSWCIPGGEGHIIAIIPETADDYPDAAALSIWEAGQELATGEPAPGMRIQAFLSDTNRGPAPDDDPRGGTDGSGAAFEATILTEAGWGILTAAINYALDPDGPGLDKNFDGSVDVLDIDELELGDLANRDAILAAFNADLGDVNNDRSFDSDDLIATFATGNYDTGAAAKYTEGDWDLDGDYDSDDLIAAFAEGSYADGPPPAAANAVPEPTGLMLLLLGSLALAARRR